jgi:DUF4097 and DUF4098 domain-containing protein YvlB
MTRVLIAAVLLAALAVTLPAQDGSSFGRSEAEWCRESMWDRDREPRHCVVREQTLTGAAALSVDASANGGVRVRGWDRSDARLRVRIDGSARSDARAQEIVDAVTIETSGGRIRATGPDTGRNEFWYASFELEVPRDARLQLEARNGGIAIESFRGTATFHTTNGGISLVDVAGDLRGDTRNGGINVQLSGTRWEGAGLDVETRNGGVKMSIPANYNAELEIGTVNGGVKIDFPITIQGDLRRFPRNVSTRLGAGGSRIRAVTTNGGVVVSRR